MEVFGYESMKQPNPDTWATQPTHEQAKKWNDALHWGSEIMSVYTWAFCIRWMVN